jgi:hypothetical protein
MHAWVLLLVGWLVGSFFGLHQVMGLFQKRTA